MSYEYINKGCVTFKMSISKVGKPVFMKVPDSHLLAIVYMYLLFKRVIDYR